jgi:phenylalanyl-tRNA synthetase beta chain
MSWLREYADADVSTRDFAEDITMFGQKVEAITKPGERIDRIVVGRVAGITKHAGADKLLVTKIDTGGRMIQVVTGARNLSVGDFVPVALDGATLANGVTIKSGELRGELSEGMLCSIEELGYTRHDYPEAPENGIYVFSEPREPGADVRPILELTDEVVEYEITSNRADCFSVVGIAREVAAMYGGPLRFPDCSPEELGGGRAADHIAVRIDAPELCPRYAARVIRNARIGVSPQWLRHRLTAAGVRPINSIVDITNYVMLELGQPMHAFDIDEIAGRRIIVRNARDGETFVTLDGQRRELDASMLVIADPEKAIAIAGIMGGENSKVTEGASAILFESAAFSGPNIRRSSKKLGLRTDASSRYEKGLDPNLALVAVNRAARLVELLGVGEVVPGVVDCYPGVVSDRDVAYTADGVNRLLGTDISGDAMASMLRRLGLSPYPGGVSAPSFRRDITREADVAEEIARVYGYDNIPATLASGTPTVGRKNREQLLEDRLKAAMAASGYSEALTYAFESPKAFDRLLLPEDSELRRAARLVNPLGEDFSVMRTSMANAILTALAANYSKRNESAALYEITKVYRPSALPLQDLPDEPKVLAFGIYGGADFYDIKGAAEAAAASAGAEADFERTADVPFLHPGRAAYVSVGGERAGYIGEVHPDVLAAYGIGERAYVAELFVAPIYANAIDRPAYKPLGRFPAARRDVALIVPEGVPAKAVERAILASAGAYIESAKLFDVYRGAGVADGRKSLAYSLSFRSPDRTLTDAQADEGVKSALVRLADEFDARPRV